MDEGAVDGHLTLRTFYRQRQRLFGVRSERRVEFAQGEKAGVQFRYVLHGDFDAQMIHKKPSCRLVLKIPSLICYPFFWNCQALFQVFENYFQNLLDDDQWRGYDEGRTEAYGKERWN